ncbi:MAG: Crp/Fnr family transcriptional regulator [Zoogloeaceae bacterium]|jgi:CRP-like cAMP-binding protein|nr:Crp/Fnr family transcriptional regulator [Zoogloeaceae bacterium]
MPTGNKPIPNLVIPAVLSRLPLFSALAQDQIERVASATRGKYLARGEILFQKGDPSHGFYIVITGQIKLALPSAQGNEKVLEIIGPQQSFGEEAMLMNSPFPVFAEALLDSQLLHISKDAVSQLINANPTFARRMLAELSSHLYSLITDIEAYTLHSSTQRLIGYLLQHSPHENDTRNRIEIKLPTSKHILASRLNLTPETFSRILHELVASGFIEVHGRSITILDLHRLRRHEF